MTTSAAVGKQSTQAVVDPVQPGSAAVLSEHEPDRGQLLQVGGHRGLPDRDRCDDLPDGHRLTARASSDTTCTRVPSASALNQDA